MKPWIDTLNEYHMPEPMSGCWLWTGSLSTRGYGQIVRTINNKQVSRGAHRVSWEHFKGPIPEGLYVCHKCDVPSCVNPDHLFIGTAKDNMQDCIRKKRIANGHRVWTSKFTEDDVRYIRASKKKNVSLAKELGVPRSTIRRIRKQITWKHIEESPPAQTGGPIEKGVVVGTSTPSF